VNTKWLNQVLAEHSHLNLEHPDGRELMAEAIFLALPKDVIVAAIHESTSAVLRQRGMLDGPTQCLAKRDAEDLAREVANNATQTVLLMLYVGADDEETQVVDVEVATAE
jgi:hypothetical protein